MAAGNNRKENTFKQKALLEAELQEEQPIITEEKKKEEKPKKSDKAPKNKDSKPQKGQEKKETDGRVTRIIGILFICLAVFLGIALISYLVNFFSGHYQEIGVGEKILNQKEKAKNSLIITDSSAGWILIRELSRKPLKKRIL